MKTKWLAVALALSTFAFTACAGASADTGEGVASLQDSTATTTATEQTEMTDEEAAIAFTECMREQGVDMEDPTVDADGNVIPGRPTNLPEPGDGEDGSGGPGGAFGEELRSAFEECGDLLQGATFGFNQVDQTELQDQLLELAACLRDQGLDVADPDLSQLGPNGDDSEPRTGGPFGIDFQDPEVQAALEQCQDLVPNFAGGPGGGFGGPGAGQGQPSTGSDG